MKVFQRPHKLRTHRVLCILHPSTHALISVHKARRKAQQYRQPHTRKHSPMMSWLCKAKHAAMQAHTTPARTSMRQPCLGYRCHQAWRYSVHRLLSQILYWYKGTTATPASLPREQASDAAKPHVLTGPSQVSIRRSECVSHNGTNKRTTKTDPASRARPICVCSDASIQQVV